MVNALLIHPDDDVVVVTKPIRKDEMVTYGDGKQVRALEDVPVYHKIAIHAIKKGNPVHKYHNIIGEAVKDIPVGAYVHVHNVKSMTKKEAV